MRIGKYTIFYTTFRNFSRISELTNFPGLLDQINTLWVTYALNSSKPFSSSSWRYAIPLIILNLRWKITSYKVNRKAIVMFRWHEPLSQICGKRFTLANVNLWKLIVINNYIFQTFVENDLRHENLCPQQDELSCNNKQTLHIEEVSVRSNRQGCQSSQEDLNCSGGISEEQENVVKHLVNERYS